MPGRACGNRRSAAAVDERNGPGDGSPEIMKTIFLCCLLIQAASSQDQPARQKWTIQYFFDELKQEMEITDLAFPSAERGIAVGAIYERGGGKEKYTSVITSDGGRHW